MTSYKLHEYDFSTGTLTATHELNAVYDAEYDVWTLAAKPDETRHELALRLSIARLSGTAESAASTPAITVTSTQQEHEPEGLDEL